MRGKLFQAMKGFPIFLIILGAVIIAVPIMSVSGQAGWSTKKSLLTFVGIFVLAGGAFLTLPIGKRYAEKLRMAIPKGVPPVSIYMVAIWFGMIAGLGEVSILLFRKLFGSKVLHMSRHFIWMIPVGEVCVFIIIAFVLRAIARRWLNQTLPGRIVFVFTFLLSLSVMIRVYEVQLFASLILAIGLAVQTAHFVRVNPGIFYWMVRRTTPVLMALVGILSLGMSGWLVFGEWHTSARSTIAAPRVPNVLLIVLDTVGAKSMSLYGYPRPTTPNLEQLAKRGVNFDWAISTAPWTLPSHGSMFTGCWHHEQSSQLGTPLDNTHQTLAEVLGAYGYSTAGFVANFGYCSYEFGLSRGFAHYEDFPVTPLDIFLSSSLSHSAANSFGFLRLKYYDLVTRKSAKKVNQDFLNWVSNKDGRPFFAFLNYFDAHAPYLPPSPFVTMFGSSGPRKDPWLSPNTQWTQDDIQTEKDQYEGCIAYIDHQIGLLYAELERRGLSKNTIIIITSDHGEQFGEHRSIEKSVGPAGQPMDCERYLIDHGTSLYIQELHVPLMILYPSTVPLGKTIQTPVSLRDIPVTILDLIGLGEAAFFPGASLARFWRSVDQKTGGEQRVILSEVNHTPLYRGPWVPAFRGDMKSLVASRYHYILNGDGSEEIYDLLQDPLESENLTNSGQGNQMLSKFRKLLKEALAHNQRKDN